MGSTEAISKLNMLLDQNNDVKTVEIRLLQGTNFGCAYTGFFDQALNLLNKIQQK